MLGILYESSPLAFVWPLQMEFIAGWKVCLLFLAGAIPIVALGIRSLSGLGPVRKWVATGVRLGVLMLALLIVAGVRWQKEHKDVEVMVLRDISESTNLVKNFPGPSSLQTALDNYLNELSTDPTKKPEDRIGVVSFHQDALIDALPSTKLALDSRAVRDPGRGTDPASAIQLGLASMSNNAMRRMLLVWDGNSTTGDLEAAIASASAQHVQIDVMPLRYDVNNEVLMERFVAPTWKRENEPFSLEIILRSTNVAEVTGKLSILHQGEPMDLDPATQEKDTVRSVTLKPGLNRQTITVPGNLVGAVHQFRAIWEGDSSVSIAGSKQGDTLSVNNVADAFTFVQGKGQILYVDNVRGGAGAGDALPRALADEGITLMPITVDQFPQSLVELQQYDAVILANVARGDLGEPRQEMLATYVHDMSGGLLMIGGEDSFGAGGWEGSKLEAVLPVDMDIPAQRQVGKGALALVMHACEMPTGIGNFWGMQCALKASEALSEHDEVAVITFSQGMNGAKSIFDYPLSEKGDGSRVNAAIRRMSMGDMMSFDESIDLAINGNPTQKGLKDSNARHKHIIAISDGDPGAPKQALIDQCKRLKISISTVTVYPHAGMLGVRGKAAEPDPNGEKDNPNLPETMKDMARKTGGRAYGPVDKNPEQLPQIFIKEATVVRRSLIHENDAGIPLQMLDATDDLVKGLGSVPPLYGLVLTSKKKDPKVQMPIAAQTGKDGILDPVLAHWQTGLGRAAVFTGDAHNKWGAEWVKSTSYSKFWAQVVRGVARPPMSTDFDIQTTQSGGKGKIVVEAIDKENRFLNFLTFAGTVLGPDNKEIPVRLVQTAPGKYEAEFDTAIAGNYVVGMAYTDRDGKGGLLRSGIAMNTSPELRDLKSNDARLQEVAQRTGGRVIDAFDVPASQLFRREGLWKSASPLPVWDWLVPFLLGLIIIDVAVRRIAWDWHSTKRMFASAGAYVRSYTTTRKVETRSTVDALAGIKQKAAEQSLKPAESAPPSVPRPDPKMKFEAPRGPAAKAAQGDITSVVGGATDKPLPTAPKTVLPKGMPGAAGDHLGGLMAAKKRAQQQIKDKELGEDR
jgi:Ca-activated chloride channel family protein